MYAYRYHSDYDLIWWIDAESKESILGAISKFLKRKKLTTDDTDRVGPFMNWFENNSKWLLIYDNIESFDLVEQCLPKKINGHVLMTTRLSNTRHGERIELDVLDKEAAETFLQKRTEIGDVDNASLLAHELGYFPLALEQAGAYIAESPGIGFAEYLSLFKQLTIKLLEEKVNLTNYKLLIAATLRLSLNKIRLESAKQFLYVCSYLSSDGICFDWFTETAKSVPETDPKFPEKLRNDLQDRLKQNKIKREIAKYSLVRFDKGKLYIHRLVQEVIRAEIGNDKQYIYACVKMLDYMYDGIDDYDSRHLINVHAFSILNHSRVLYPFSQWSEMHALIPHLEIVGEDPKLKKEYEEDLYLWKEILTYYDIVGPSKDTEVEDQEKLADE